MRWGKISVKGKIFSCLAVFSVSILIVLWLFQTVFLDAFYRLIKESEVRNYSQTIVENINDNDLDELLNRVTESGDICVHLIGASGEQLQESGKFKYCSLQEMDTAARAILFEKVLAKGSPKMMYFEGLDGVGMEEHSSTSVEDLTAPKPQWKGKPFFNFDKIQQSLSYFQMATMPDGSQVMVCIGARITPLNATVQTLRLQIVCIAVLFFALAGVLSVLMSRFIARPIEDMNRSSKELARGNYDVSFNGKGYREITELSDTLNVTAQALGRVDRLRKELVANVSHDLRTPLTMIIGYGEVMRDIPGENTAENIQIIIDEAQRLNLLVNDLLDLSQVEAGVRKLEKQRFNLTESIQETLTRYQKLVEQQGYTVEFEAEGAAYIYADRVKIDQAVYNLINNAISFTGEGKKVTVRQSVTSSQVRVDVIDYGVGIPPEEMDSIWERYYSKKTPHRRAMIGTGLGLSIVQEVLRMHDAAFGVESELGKGSDFWFILPLDRTEAL
ncbi:MAG: HAMP domain-containing sensor histidine kinase [Oscillospiraceae bacterium]|nr:HAMP domain-containing sensor histidine kinase [Oscillospiraceae bacterium]